MEVGQMLNKSILLNLNLAKNDMSAAIYISIVFIVIYFIAANSFVPTSLFLLVAIVFYAVFFVRVLNKVFFTSFFGDEGMMYMTLPLSAKDTVLGKVLAVAGFLTMSQFVLFGGIILAMFLIGLDLNDFMATTVSDTSAVETAFAFGLVPIVVFCSSLFTSAFMLAIFLRFGLQKKKLLPCWIIYLVMMTILGQLEKILEDVTFRVVVDSLVGIIIYLGVTFLLIKYSIKNLEERYNV